MENKKKHKSRSSVIRSEKDIFQSQTQRQYAPLLKFLKPELHFSFPSTQSKQDHLPLIDSKILAPETDTHSIIKKLKRLKPQQRIRNLSISKAIMIEDLIMQEKTRDLSKYITKGTFDFGLKNYFIKIAEQVKCKLAIKHIAPSDNLVLVQEKKLSAVRKYQMLKKHRQDILSKTSNGSSLKDSMLYKNKSKQNLNINFRKHNLTIQSKRNRKESKESKEQPLISLNNYFNM